MLTEVKGAAQAHTTSEARKSPLSHSLRLVIRERLLRATHFTCQISASPVKWAFIPCTEIGDSGSRGGEEPVPELGREPLPS